MLLFLTACNLSLHSQPYLPVIQENKDWALLQTACDLDGGIQAWLEGDSMLDATTYKIVWAVNCGDPQPSGFLREDTSTGRLWFRENGQSAEKLIMDLSLQEGDIFYFDDASSSPYEIAVDKVEIIDGRRVVFFSKEQINCITVEDLPIRFIEGIGPSPGFFYSASPLNSISIPLLLSCVLKGDSLLYQETAVSWVGCDYDCITADIGELQYPPVKVTLSPNPFSESTSITITGLSQRAVYFSLYGPRGRLLRREQLLSPSFELRRGALPAGLYFYRIESEGEMMGSGKVAVQ
ncbi:MAG: T9SS type A sorting domain-containing protein [Lewinellaceae bacterium]|nr:T9SS type A sorting domain-containing protein [Lewinellaceae bacterium]